MSFAHPTPDLRKDGHVEREEHITSHSRKGQLTPTRPLLKTQHFAFVSRTLQNILEMCQTHQNPRGAQLFVKFLYIYQSIAITVKAPKPQKSVNQKYTKPCTTDPWKRTGQKDIFSVLAFHSSPTNPSFTLRCQPLYRRETSMHHFREILFPK